MDTDLKSAHEQQDLPIANLCNVFSSQNFAGRTQNSPI
jgi:hypothetical protein